MYIQTVAPSQEPVALADAKLQIKLDPELTDDDDLVTDLISDARQHVETDLWRQLLTATWRLNLDSFRQHRHYHHYGMFNAEAHLLRFLHHQEIRLEVCKVQAVNAIKYYDTTGTLQTLDSSAYQLDLDSEPARIRPAPQTVWPVAQYDRLNAVQVEFIAGYGDDPSSVPTGIKKYMLAWIAFHYEHRGDDDVNWPEYLENQLDPFRWKIAPQCADSVR